jgi:hypothetical protein
VTTFEHDGTVAPAGAANVAAGAGDSMHTVNNADEAAVMCSMRFGEFLAWWDRGDQHGQHSDWSRH